MQQLNEQKTDNAHLAEISSELKAINRNLLNVFWIVGFFAFLYFGLMIYLMFYR